MPARRSHRRRSTRPVRCRHAVKQESTPPENGITVAVVSAGAGSHSRSATTSNRWYSFGRQAAQAGLEFLQVPQKRGRQIAMNGQSSAVVHREEDHRGEEGIGTASDRGPQFGRHAVPRDCRPWGCSITAPTVIRPSFSTHSCNHKSMFDIAAFLAYGPLRPHNHSALWPLLFSTEFVSPHVDSVVHTISRTSHPCNWTPGGCFLQIPAPRL